MSSGSGASPNEGQGSSGAPSWGGIHVTQNDINQQIVKELASLDNRLNNITSNQAKFRQLRQV